MKLIFGMSVLLSSLYSLYFFGVPLVTLFGVFLLVLVKVFSLRDYSLKHNYAFYFFASIFYISCFSVLFGSEVNAVRFCVFLSFLILLIILSVNSDWLDIRYTLTVFLIFHMLFFYVQFISYYFFDIYLSVLPAFGLESRNFGGTLVLPWGAPVMRASGLYSEPGTYACFLAPMVALYSRYTSDSKARAIYILSLLSLALSLSTFGIVFFTMIVVFLMSSVFLKAMVLFVGVLFGFPYFYWRFVIRMEAGLSTGLGFRYEYITAALDNFTSIKGFLLGFGGFGINQFAFSNGGADNDSGLIFYILYNFGGLAFIISIFLLIWVFLKYDRCSAVGVLILFLSKISFFAFVFPVYMFFLLTTRKISFDRSGGL